MTKSRGAGASDDRTISMTRAYAGLILLFPLYATLWFLATVVRRLPDSVTRKLLRAHTRYTQSRLPNVRIPGDQMIAPYMLRWWRIPRNWLFNVYFHRVLRSDDDRALHDHPWWSFSIVLAGGYYEHTIAAGGTHHKQWMPPGTMRFRWSGRFAHRLELRNISAYNSSPLDELPAHTIFITGPVMRRWGFHGIDRWVDAYDWDDYCAANGIGGMKMQGYAEQLTKGPNE